MSFFRDISVNYFFLHLERSHAGAFQYFVSEVLSSSSGHTYPLQALIIYTDIELKTETSLYLLL